MKNEWGGNLILSCIINPYLNNSLVALQRLSYIKDNDLFKKKLSLKNQGILQKNYYYYDGTQHDVKIRL